MICGSLIIWNERIITCWPAGSRIVMVIRSRLITTVRAGQRAFLQVTDEKSFLPTPVVACQASLPTAAFGNTSIRTRSFQALNRSEERRVGKACGDGGHRQA